MECCTEVPVLIEELGCEAHDNVSCRLLVEVLVAFVNLAVGVAVNIETFDWFACLVVNLLVNEERVGCLTYTVCLYLSAVTTRDGCTGLDVVVGIAVATCKRGNLVVVP